MLRPLIATSAALLVLLAAASAGAQEPARSFAQRGQLIVSADWLVPLIAYDNQTTSPSPNPNNASTSNQTTTISLLPNINGANGAPNFYNIPRIAFDYAVVDHLTIGGAVYAAFVPSNKTTTQATAANGTVTTTTSDNGTTTVFGIAPRVGYAIPISSAFAFWPRGGFSFNTLNVSTKPNTTVIGPVTTTNQTSTTVNEFAIDLEAIFVVAPVHHFGFFFGPVLDIPLTGSNDSTTTTTTTTANSNTVTTAQNNNSFSDLHVGVTIGLLGWF